MGRPRGSKNKKKETTEDLIQASSCSMSANEVAEHEKKRAVEKGLPDPDFDFRELYQPGDTIYYVWINYLTGDKELLELKIRTIYARSMVAWEDRGPAHMIGYPSRDWIFYDRREAEVYYQSVKVTGKYLQQSNDDLPQLE